MAGLVEADAILEAQILGVNGAEYVGIGFVASIWGFIISLFGELVGAASFFTTTFTGASLLIFIPAIVGLVLHRQNVV